MTIQFSPLFNRNWMVVVVFSCVLTGRTQEFSRRAIATHFHEVSLWLGQGDVHTIYPSGLRSVDVPRVHPGPILRPVLRQRGRPGQGQADAHPLRFQRSQLRHDFLSTCHAIASRFCLNVSLLTASLTSCVEELPLPTILDIGHRRHLTLLSLILTRLHELWPEWRTTVCLLLELHINELGATGLGKGKMVAICLPLILLL